MSQRFQLGVRTSNVTSGQALLEIIAPTVASGLKGCRVLNFNITLATGVTGVFGTGRPAATGITPTTPVSFLSDLNGDPSLTKIALAWGTSPTAPAAFFHRITVPTTAPTMANGQRSRSVRTSSASAKPAGAHTTTIPPGFSAKR